MEIPKSCQTLETFPSVDKIAAIFYCMHNLQPGFIIIYLYGEEFIIFAIMLKRTFSLVSTLACTSGMWLSFSNPDTDFWQAIYNHYGHMHL